MPGAAERALAAGGPVAQAVDGFRVRRAQQEMAAAIEDALAARSVLLCEAGTGTGKTFAYLVPALLSGLRVIVSTGTRTLQDQLITRDLPRLRAALGIRTSAGVLKGRSNYLCRHRLELAARDGLSTTGALEAVRSWAAVTRSGDLAELAGISEQSALRAQVTSTAENCLGQECPAYDECWVVRARREAAAVDLLVVNHHLFLADTVLRGEGFVEFLPGADAFIMDEAHQLPELAGEFLGSVISSRQLLELAQDCVRLPPGLVADEGAVVAAATRIEGAVGGLRAALGAASRRASWTAGDATFVAGAALDDVLAALQALHEACCGEESDAPAPLLQFRRRVSQLQARLDDFARADAAEESVRWFETRGRGFALNRTPIDIAAPFQARMRAFAAAWVFVSATLAVGEDFSHFRDRLGLTEARACRYGSPFDFARQALLYLPGIEVEPSSVDYDRAVVEVVREVTAASAGRAFVLFTSHRALKAAAAALGEGFPFPLLVQDTAPQHLLLERFRAAGNAVLLGTASFWEGVDVRGEALSCVVIDRLPFAPPDDPVLTARSAAIREVGGNPFRALHLPAAVIALKQGVGRLIRDEDDHGVLVICDPRLEQRGYGRTFLASLPTMPMVRDIAAVRAFFDARSGATREVEAEAPVTAASLPTRTDGRDRARPPRR